MTDYRSFSLDSGTAAAHGDCHSSTVMGKSQLKVIANNSLTNF